MLSIIGAILVIGATATIGLSSWHKMRMRVEILTALITLLRQMKDEITGRLTPIPELLELCIESNRGPVRNFLCRVEGQMKELGISPFRQIWQDAVEASPDLLLAPEEKQSLIDLGRSLGRYDAHQQEEAFDYTINRLASALEKARMKKTEEGRVHAVLGVVSGVFMVLILL